MTFLLLLASGLALTSGLLQLLGKSRIPGTIPLISLVELLSGLLLPLLVLTRPLPTSAGAPLLAFMVGLVLYSGSVRLLRARARRRYREETEASRLVTYVKYLSAQGEEAKDTYDQGAGDR